MPRWVQRPAGSTWGDWGADDQLGRLNLLDATKVRQGVDEVMEGQAFCLSLPLDVPGGNALNPRRLPPKIHPTFDENGDRYLVTAASIDPRWVDVICDDTVELALQYSSQWDALSHVGAHFDISGNGVEEPVFYNGFRAGVDVQGPAELGSATSYAAKLGVENLAVKPIQGRGVLVDLNHHLGDDERYVDLALLREIMDADGVVVEPGDILMLHTGWSTKVWQNKGTADESILHHSCPVIDGLDEDLLDWVSTSQIAAIVADNYAVEGLPNPDRRTSERQSLLPLHHHCLFKLGLPLGEMWYLKELATALRDRGRNRCLLTAPPLRLPGAVGSPANAIATI